MKFKASVRTKKIGSECEIEFEVDDEALADLDQEQRDDLIDLSAREAIEDSGLIEIWWEETS